ncbi:LysR family transcriptional regulator [Lactobacillus sp. ESL0731]|uniref:LysR family transcriptional regulator n=1 Tax=unclassified Lactobacillus TaxID=2620435 RepID=UPI0023F6644E|nr:MULTISPECIES: LysR family transcriptional regulator [unclassified Lactobacillus]WEV50392.1 LysR family transcriptional regulator [Lactobacillus sp. ESL0700]WEV61522.1 LysR family transcriptional regulator [Lactobacillus sp. ESL0731]
MNTEYLRLFLNLAETLNFSQTAKNVNLTQPAVTHAINKLEQDLGFKLFNRNKRTVELTEGGKILHENVQSILVKLDTTIQSARAAEEKEFSSLAIGYTSTYYEIQKFPELIKQFNKLHPASRLYLENFDHNVLKQHLLSQQCDVIFSMQDIINSQNIKFIPLIKGQFACIVPNANHLANHKSLKITDLKNETMIFFNANICPPRQFKLQRLIKEVCPNANYLYSDSVLLSHTFVKGNLGIAMMVDLASVKDSPDFKVIPLEYPDEFPYVYGLSFLKNTINPTIKDFVPCVTKYFI